MARGEERSVEEKCWWQLGREVRGGRKNKRRKIKKDIARMQECAQVQGGVDTRYLRRSYCSCSYVSSPTFLHLASGNIVTFSDIWTNFRNIFRALFPPCRRSRLLLWHNKMFTHQISNAARTRQLFSYHSVKGEGGKKTHPHLHWQEYLC